MSQLSLLYHGRKSIVNTRLRISPRSELCLWKLSPGHFWLLFVEVLFLTQNECLLSVVLLKKLVRHVNNCCEKFLDGRINIFLSLFTKPSRLSINSNSKPCNEITYIVNVSLPSSVFLDSVWIDLYFVYKIDVAPAHNSSLVVT